MRQRLDDLCNLFIENRDRIKSGFHWESAYIYPVCAAIFMDKGRHADVDRMKECREILKNNTGLFSNFRGIAKLAMVSLLAVDSEPESRMERSARVYNLLKEQFFSSSYLPVASMLISGVASPGEYEGIAQKTREIYDLMKKEHPFLTSGEDSIFAAMLALSDRKGEDLAREMEHCYDILHDQFFSGNAVQSLSHVLALSELPADEKCHRTMKLFQELKSKGHTYGTGYELATLGVLALLSGETSAASWDSANEAGEHIQKISEEIIEADNFLKEQKGYGTFGIGRKQRLMHAGMIVTSAHMESESGQTLQNAAISGTISLIAAQQAAMCAAIAASSTAAAASSSANG